MPPKGSPGPMGSPTASSRHLSPRSCDAKVPRDAPCRPAPQLPGASRSDAQAAHHAILRLQAPSLVAGIVAACPLKAVLEWDTPASSARRVGVRSGPLARQRHCQETTLGANAAAACSEASTWPYMTHVSPSAPQKILAGPKRAAHEPTDTHGWIDCSWPSLPRADGDARVGSGATMVA